MSEEIPKELLDTGLRWTATERDGQYVAYDGAFRYDCHTRAGRVDLTMLRYDYSGWTSSNACRPTVAEALAVARRMIEAAQ